jgi:hypothetical protein
MYFSMNPFERILFGVLERLRFQIHVFH